MKTNTEGSAIADKNIVCTECGEKFVFSAEEQRYFAEMGFSSPKRCRACRKKRRHERELAQQAENDRKWFEEEKRKIDELLLKMPYRKIAAADMRISAPDRALIILGNGFDLMHGVRSRYSDFRDFLGKRDELRDLLEIYIRSDSLWSDFEEALAHIDAGMMFNTLDMWMDVMGAYDEDASAASYFMACEAATAPAWEIPKLLKKKFRRWVETLMPTKDPMWKNIISPESSYLNFNYTEFIETLYGIPSQKVLYIHGCRGKKKQELIVGHAPYASDGDEWSSPSGIPHYRSRIKSELYAGALGTAETYISWYDEDTTKKTDEIIEKHRAFFDSLSEIDTVVTLGHSLAKVDYPYFEEIIRSNTKKADWIIGWYSSGDLENISLFIEKMKIPKEKITLMK